MAIFTGKTNLKQGFLVMEYVIMLSLHSEIKLLFLEKNIS